MNEEIYTGYTASKQPLKFNRICSVASAQATHHYTRVPEDYSGISTSDANKAKTHPTIIPNKYIWPITEEYQKKKHKLVKYLIKYYS
jgi:hypothetical protein